MGNPAYTNPQPRGPGHIVGLTWDSAIRKFGIDRGAGVWSDEGNPDKVRFWFAFGELGKGVGTTWKSQRLTEGLPVMTTVFEEAGVRYEVEQFAYPLHGPPAERRGDMPMVLLQRLTVTELTGTPRSLPVSMTHRRQLPQYVDADDRLRACRATRFSSASGAAAACCSPIQGAGEPPPWSGTSDYQSQQPAETDRRDRVRRPASQGNPPVRREAAVADGDGRGRRGADGDRLCGRTRADAEVLVRVRRPRRAVPRAGAGRQRPVPRQPLARAPVTPPARRLGAGRRHRPALLQLRVQPDGHPLAGEPGRVRGLHALRRCAAITPSPTKSSLAQFRNNQEHDGHVSGYANWLVYTPAMLYAMAQNYLLSQDRRRVREAAAAGSERDGLVPRAGGARCARRRRGGGPGARAAQRPDGTGRLGVQPGIPVCGPRPLRACARAARPPARRGGARCRSRHP